MQTTGVLTILLALLATGAYAETQDELLTRLRLDHAALTSAESDYRRQRRSGTLRGAEASDYAAYVARLQRRVLEDCAQLARLPEPLAGDLPCPATPPAVVQSAVIDQQAEQTHAERIAGLDAELTAVLGEYDEMLLREQERIKAATPRQEADGGAGGGSGQATGGPDGGTAAAGQSGAAADSERGSPGGAETDAGDVRPGAGSGAGRPARGGPGPPPDIPDGSDDDVVARQLREAAEKETDPELRKKLWEEYRKYKQGTARAGTR